MPSEAAEPIRVALGGVRLVLPQGRLVLSPPQWALLAAAVLLDADGAADQALGQIARLETALGVTDIHRLAADQGVAAARQAMAARLAQARRRPRPAPAAADTDRLSRDELRRLTKAERKLASPDRSIRGQGGDEILALTRRRAERREALDLAASLAETAALARARGEDVRTESFHAVTPVTDDQGGRVLRGGLPLYRQQQVARVRVLSRGGLQLAFEHGDLDGGADKPAILHDIGQSYRWAFETSTALTTPRRDLAAIGARSPLRSSAGPQDAVFVAGDLLRVMRDGLTERQRAVLDRVCGLDTTVRATAKAMKAGLPTTRAALRDGLAHAADARARLGKARRAG